MVLRWLKYNFLIILVACFCKPALGQVGASAGYFNITSETSSGSTNISNLGHFKLTYDIPISYQFALVPSYSLYLLGFGTTDIGYGFNLEFQYFPLSFNRPMKLGRKNLNFMSSEKLRPFIGLSFHQRQFQSIQSNYAGMGLNFGTHYQFSEQYRLLAGLSFLSLKGPLDASIVEQFLYVGISLE